MKPIPQQAIDLIRKSEGCLLAPYKDSAGLLTIGIGHLIKSGEKFSTITQQQAEELLRADLQAAANSVCRLITRPLNDNEYSALLSFTFNVGGGALQRSQLRQLCNRGDNAGAMEQFIKWNKAGGKVSSGLTRRRIEESMLYGKEI